jgi:hypothetical protein
MTPAARRGQPVWRYTGPIDLRSFRTALDALRAPLRRDVVLAAGRALKLEGAELTLPTMNCSMIMRLPVLCERADFVRGPS